MEKMMFIDEPIVSYSPSKCDLQMCEYKDDHIEYKYKESNTEYKYKDEITSTRKYKNKEVASPIETNDYIKQYIHSKSYCRCTENNIEITKNNKKYIAKYLASNKHYSDKDHTRYLDTDPFELGFIMFLITPITALLCGIPNIAGVIIFTIIHLIMFANITIRADKYSGITCGTVVLSAFLIIVFIAHFVLNYELSEHPNYANIVKAYNAFHTIYPEYLFKFKF